MKLSHLDFTRIAGSAGQAGRVMATYDLDRWSRQVRKKNNQAEASLTLHLHPSHCRFEHQNGVFLYDSPIKGLLESIKDARLPVELLDLLDATAVKYFEGCLVVEVVDHRGVVEAEGSGVPGAGNAGNSARNGLGGDGINSATHSRNGSLAGSLSRSMRGSEPNILQPKLSISMSDGSDTPTALPQKFMTSYRSFESALRECAKLRDKGLRDSENQQRWQHQQQEELRQRSERQQTGDSQADNHLEGNKENQTDVQNDIHSAVAAAVASAASMPAGENGVLQTEEDAAARNRPLAYRITLGPDIETIWTDLCALREEKRAAWTEDDMLAMESRILALTAPPLCLAPDMQVSRIANTLLDATSLPVSSPIPSRKREPSQATKAAKSGKRARNRKDIDSDAAGSDAQSRVVHRTAEELEEEAWLRVMDESHSSRLAFQPSFSRLAFLQNWREKQNAEKERHQKQMADAAAARAQAQADAEAHAQEQAQPRVGPSNDNSRQGSVQHSRQGSVIDIPVNAPTPANASFSLQFKDEAGEQQAPPKKKKTNKNKDKAAGRAGSPAYPNSSAADLSVSTNTAPTSLKLTLPGKNKKKDKNAIKAGSPDIAVNPSPPPSANAGGPMSAGPAGSPAPTAAQQAINRKTANLPKAKLKSDVKAQAHAQALLAQSNGAGTPQNTVDSPATQQETPQMSHQQLNQMGQQQIRPGSTVGQMGLPAQPQRNFISPVRNNQQQQGQQQFSPPQHGGQMPQIAPGQPMNFAQTQEYMNQLQQQIAQFQQNASRGGQQMNFNMNGAQFNQNMQGQNQRPVQNQFPMQPPQGTQPNPGQQNFGNIHRSPVHANAALPQQQQQQGMQTPQSSYQYNPFNNSGSPNMGGNNQQQFTPQQAFQLQQLQQQQNIIAQRQQALQNHVANFGQQGNNMPPNMQFNMNAYPQQQQQQPQMPFGPQSMQNMQNMPNMNLQNMPMGQFNPAMINQFQRQQQQQQQHMGMAGYGNQPQPQQGQWQGQ